MVHPRWHTLFHGLLDSPPAEERILSLPQECSHLASECSRWTICPTGLIQGRGLSRSGALKPVGSLPCELELDGAVPGSAASRDQSCARSLQQYPRASHSAGLHFQSRGEFPYLLSPMPFLSLLHLYLMLGRDPSNQEPAPRGQDQA